MMRLTSNPHVMLVAGVLGGIILISLGGQGLYTAWTNRQPAAFGLGLLPLRRNPSAETTTASQSKPHRGAHCDGDSSFAFVAASAVRTAS